LIIAVEETEGNADASAERSVDDMFNAMEDFQLIGVLRAVIELDVKLGIHVRQSD
jgi:hypothetical protein